jgi:hypothetical protein
VALWYQTEPHKRWPALPPGSQRLPFREVTLVKGWQAVPSAKHSAHPFEVQEVAGASDGKQLWLRPGDDSGWVDVTFSVASNLTAELWGRLTHSWDYGIYRVKLDGKEIGQFDLHHANATPTPLRWGMRTLAAGPHTLRFECVGKSEKSKGYFFGFDALTARIPVYARPSNVDLRTLQKK